ncbi:MAG: amidohydrolase family protein [Planctomycetes bacterium]|nr:amidohydrolase family protein [Planctomycetota bacterium]
MFIFPVLLVLTAAFAPGGGDKSEPQAERVTAIRGGKVVWNPELENPVYDPGTVIFRGNKIIAVGPTSTTAIPEGAEIVDAKNRWVVPGIIELHNHTGAGGASNDLHEYVYLTNPDLRMIDAVRPESDDMKDALVGGVTTVLTIPGSGNNMSGHGVLMKTGQLPIEEAVIRAHGSLKVAQAGNPESYLVGVGRSFMNWSTRDQLTRGRDYTAKMKGKSPEERKKSPDYNMQLEEMIDLFEHRVPIAVHTQMYQVVASTVRILNKDFGLDAFLDHSTFDGYLNWPEVVKYKVPTVVGPRAFYKDPNTNSVRGIMNEWYSRSDGKIEIGTNTDSPVVPQQELPYQAAMGVRFGYPNTRLALRGMTTLAARIVKVEDRIGSLEVNKDADVVMWTGDPIDPRSRVLKAFVNGKLCYDEQKDGIRH